MATIAEMQEATLRAQKRTGAKIAVSVKAGVFQIEAVQYDSNGVATVSILTPDLKACEVAQELDKL